MSIRVINAVWQNSRQKGNALLILQAIADFADDDGYAFPAVATIAAKARVSERTAQTVIASLQKAGELTVEKNAGPRGANRYRVLITEARQLALSDERGAADRTGARNDRVQTSAPEPSRTSSSNSHQVPDGSRATQIRTPAKPAPPAGSRQESRRIEEEAVALWQRLRKRSPHLKRFTEASSIRGLRIAVKRALMAGHSWLDISAAITAKAPEATSNPWYADEWIRLTAERRLEAEKEAEQRQQREDVERERTAALVAERAALQQKYPGLTWKQIIERELFGGVLKPMPNTVQAEETPVRGSVVQLFGPRGEERTWQGGRGQSSGHADPQVLSREPAQGPAKLATGGSAGPVAREVTAYPEVLGPDRISLLPQDFACSVGQKCPRKGSRWVRLGPDQDPLPCCRQCFDERVAAQRREGVG